MEREMININANLIQEPTISSFEREGEEVKAANFTLAKKYGKGKEYIHCAVYGDRVTDVMKLTKDDFVHVFGYFNNRVKDGKTYKNFVVKSFNKIEANVESEEE